MQVSLAIQEALSTYVALADRNGSPQNVVLEQKLHARARVVLALLFLHQQRHHLVELHRGKEGRRRGVGKKFINNSKGKTIDE